MKTKRKTIRAYINGKVLVSDVVQAALDNNMSIDAVKKMLVDENPNDKITFKVV